MLDLFASITRSSGHAVELSPIAPQTIFGMATQDFLQDLIEVHRVVGLINILAVAPLAMLSFTRSGWHKRMGKIYFYLMIFLYMTGTLRTFWGHEIPSIPFARNVAFNFFGFSLVFYGYRSIYLMYAEKFPKPTALDRSLAGLLFISSVSLAVVGCLNFSKLYPMTLIGGLGFLLACVEVYELKNSFTKKSALFSRHMRYMLASYYYVIMVFLVVEDIVKGKGKWLGPMLISIPVIALTTRTSTKWLGKRHQKVFDYAIKFSMAIPWIIFILASIMH
ncbi:hypothetical protein HY256_03300 [Candidatus Sumerlaeota bacterium]|nr:hypothetical protein [Candidatus Sumerlaeota bacterium]